MVEILPWNRLEKFPDCFIYEYNLNSKRSKLQMDIERNLDKLLAGTDWELDYV
jgi:hypothetical protein